MVEQRVDGAEISDLPCLDLKKNPNVTSDNMAGIRRQWIVVDDNNDPAPQKITDEAPQPEGGYSWRPEWIICSSRSKKLHKNYAAFKNYSCEEAMKTTKLELFLI